MNEQIQGEKRIIGYCIKCGKPGRYNPDFPYCDTCGGVCTACSDRSSASDALYLFCHRCGETAYVSPDQPLCDDCLEEIKKVSE